MRCPIPALITHLSRGPMKVQILHHTREECVTLGVVICIALRKSHLISWLKVDVC